MNRKFGSAELVKAVVHASDYHREKLHLLVPIAFNATILLQIDFIKHKIYVLEESSLYKHEVTVDDTESEDVDNPVLATEQIDFENGEGGTEGQWHLKRNLVVKFD